MVLSQIEVNVVDELKAGSHILRLRGKGCEETESLMQNVLVDMEA